MAKAKFHKSQRVYVVPVGTWALIERVVPHWAKNVEEPVKITYDVGLGRDFGANELQTEQIAAFDENQQDGENWRMIRGANKWKTPEECAHHPQPGTYPIIVTNEKDWGGWRVPGAEYDHDPRKIEAQANVIVHAPHCVMLLKEILAYAEEQPENMSNHLMDILQRSRRLIEAIQN